MIQVTGNTKKGLKISQWLKERGFVHEKDYIWYCRSEHKVVVFEFTENQRKLETLIALKWS